MTFEKCEHPLIDSKEEMVGGMKKVSFFCVKCKKVIGYWAEDEHKIYMEFEKRGDMYSIFPSPFGGVKEKIDPEYDHEMSEEDKEDLK